MVLNRRNEAWQSKVLRKVVTILLQPIQSGNSSRLKEDFHPPSLRLLQHAIED